MIGRRGRYDTDLRFYLLELFHGASTPCTSDAAVLEATLFESVVDESPGVDPDRAGLDEMGDSLCAVDIFREDCSGQTVDGGVRARNRLVLCRESLKAQHGAENFLLDQWNVQRFRFEHGGAIECTGRQRAVHDWAAANNDPRIPRCIFDD